MYRIADNYNRQSAEDIPFESAGYRWFKQHQRTGNNDYSRVQNKPRQTVVYSGAPFRTKLFWLCAGIAVCAYVNWGSITGSTPIIDASNAVTAYEQCKPHIDWHNRPRGSGWDQFKPMNDAPAYVSDKVRWSLTTEACVKLFNADKS